MSSFPPLSDSFAAVLAVKGALTPRPKNRAPLTAPGRCKHGSAREEKQK